jgi:pyruvate/2-oxoglutarate dehydrogenase complex dihydrolipoamide dehydrogenase (E3) component
MPVKAILRARTLSEERGFLKMLIDEHSNRILGFTAFCAEGGELMAVVQTVILNGIPFTSLRDAIFTHPTMAEGLNGLLKDVRDISLS